MRILLVEDDELLGDGVRAGLVQPGDTVEWIKDGLSAQQTLITEKFDIIILDLGLPRLGGLELLRWARSSGIKTPVLILTARETIEDRVKGLDSGADDYLTKPFDLGELCARVRALARRSANTELMDAILTYETVKLDPISHVVTIAGEIINISRREFALLQKLLENPGRVLSREQLSQSLYGWDDDVDSNALEVHIHNLRKKLGGGKFIRTIRGIGYMVEKNQER
jgi:two-component system, OmpR family, response regulator QseB